MFTLKRTFLAAASGTGLPITQTGVAFVTTVSTVRPGPRILNCHLKPNTQLNPRMLFQQQDMTRGSHTHLIKFQPSGLTPRILCDFAE